MPPVRCGPVEITFTRDADVLTFGNKAYWIDQWHDLLSVGESRGEHLPIANSDGRLIRTRLREQLSVELFGVVVNGKYNDDNTINCTTDKVAKTITYKRELVDFFAAGADRQFDIAFDYTQGATTLEFEGSATFEAFGNWTDPLPHAYQTSILITIASGILTEPAP